MIKALFIFAILIFQSFAVMAVTTAEGKITLTQGHYVPSCRTVAHQENDTGTVLYFRIPDVPGSDISAVILAAMMADRDVTITYTVGQTTGYGGEPAITYVSVI